MSSRLVTIILFWKETHFGAFRDFMTCYRSALSHFLTFPSWWVIILRAQDF